VKLEKSPPTLRKAAPALGEDNEPLLQELGLSAGDIAALRDKGIIA
jgi:formyl-CoA transferase